MSASRLARLIRRAGRVAEPAPAPPVLPEARTIDRRLAGSVQVRHVDCGSCNGCEIEVGAAFGPVYDVDRYGARLVASPRHADVLLVTGVVTRNMEAPLLRTVEATPRPRVVVAVGDCAVAGGLLGEGYGVVGPVGQVVGVDLAVPGCPPEPEAIVEALRRVTRR